MAITFRLPGRFSKPVVEEQPAPTDAENTTGDAKDMISTEKHADDDDSSSTEYQHGDEAIRAMTQAWSRRDLIVAYILCVPGPNP